MYTHKAIMIAATMRITATTMMMIVVSGRPVWAAGVPGTTVEDRDEEIEEGVVEGGVTVGGEDCVVEGAVSGLVDRVVEGVGWVVVGIVDGVD